MMFVPGSALPAALCRFSAVLLIALCAPLFRAQAADLARPEGAVVLTVAGAIERTNRGPFDPAADLFLKFHERSFDKAAAFDRAMLADLGMHAIEVEFDGWDEPVYLEGPYLRDLVATVGGPVSGGTSVGAEEGGITLLALDGYASKISWHELRTLDWIVAIRQDGQPLGLGQRGPLWVVYTYPDGRALSAEDELRWPWATFYIEIR